MDKRKSVYAICVELGIPVGDAAQDYNLVLLVNAVLWGEDNMDIVRERTAKLRGHTNG